MTPTIPKQKEGGGRFVHAAFDGARIVPHRDAKFAQAMQQAEIKRHLLETAAGNETHKGAFRPMVAKARNGEPRLGLRGKAATGQRRDDRLDAAALESA